MVQVICRLHKNLQRLGAELCFGGSLLAECLCLGRLVIHKESMQVFSGFFAQARMHELQVGVEYPTPHEPLYRQARSPQDIIEASGTDMLDQSG